MRIRNLNLFRKLSFAGFIVLLLVLSALILMSYKMKQKRGMDFVDAFLLEVCSPFQKGVTVLLQGVDGVFQKYLFLVHLQKENTVLKQRIAELQNENHQMQEMALANERMRHQLQFRERMATPMIAAEIIGQDPSSWFKSVTIDRGESHGVQKGMAVISPDGVIGQILKTGPHYSTVLLITDYSSAIDAIVQRTRARAIVEGKGENRCQLKYLLRSEDVSPGDVVVTAGSGGNFPKGLLIGEIQKVEKKGLGVFQHAELIPSVDLTKLEEVFIIPESSLLATKEEKEQKERKIPPERRKKK
jgi:rod shape-determining protein MreC